MCQSGLFVRSVCSMHSIYWWLGAYIKYILTSFGLNLKWWNLEKNQNMVIKNVKHEKRWNMHMWGSLFKNDNEEWKSFNSLRHSNLLELHLCRISYRWMWKSQCYRILNNLRSETSFLSSIDNKGYLGFLFGLEVKAIWASPFSSDPSPKGLKYEGWNEILIEDLFLLYFLDLTALFHAGNGL